MLKHKKDEDEDEDEEDEEEDYPEQAKTMARQKRGVVEGKQQWSGCLRVIDTISQNTISLLELEKGEACFCVCLCVFASRPEIQFVVAGCGVGVDPSTRACSSASVKVCFCC